MKLDDDYDEFSKTRFQTTAVGVGVALVIAVLLFVLICNSDSLKKSGSSASASVSTPSEVSYSFTEPEERTYTSSSLRPSDLDFYEMYPEGETSAEDPLTEPVEEIPENTDPSTDGNHTLITYADGTEEWVEISDYIKQNSYDYTRLYCQDGIMEYYDEGGKKISYFGVDVSKEQDYIDYIKLRNAGCDFVMIRVGARGYTSGQLSIDDYFKDNIKRATDAGLDVGVYFLSQAITEEEAVEEAELVLDNIEGYELTYPVCYVMQYPEDGNCRVETLTRSEKTMIARAFLNKIEEEGYKPMIYGTKLWLIKYLELSKIASDFDVWLKEEADLPTYPYRFTIWQYSDTGTIAGIKGEVSFNISFVDYSLR